MKSVGIMVSVKLSKLKASPTESLDYNSQKIINRVTTAQQRALLSQSKKKAARMLRSGAKPRWNTKSPVTYSYYTSLRNSNLCSGNRLCSLAGEVHQQHLCLNAYILSLLEVFLS